VVKKFLSITALFHLLLLFGCIVSSNTGRMLDSTVVLQSAQLAETGQQTVLSGKNLLCPCNPIENAISGVSNAFPSFSKLPFFDFIAFIRSSEQVFLSTFLHYRFFARKLLLRFFSCDIIYPFHSFW
jgi:hypothetical protein